MIITRSPLRISLAGRTDLPSYYRNMAISRRAAIDKYVYIIINQRFVEQFSSNIPS